MKTLRLVSAVLLLAALTFASLKTTSSASTLPPQAPCNANVLALAFTGSLHLTSLQNYGCDSEWAFTWATVGTGDQAIGVTEVLHYSAKARTWSIVSRATDCKPSVLPSDIYQLGCFSN